MQIDAAGRLPLVADQVSPAVTLAAMARQVFSLLPAHHPSVGAHRRPERVGSAFSHHLVQSPNGTEAPSVLAVDLDRQGNLQKDLGYREDDRHDQGEMLFRALTDDDRHLEPVLTEVRPNLDVIPGGEQIEYADAGLARQGFDPRLLAAKLAPLASEYDCILIDCPPAGGIMTSLAMGAARGLVISEEFDHVSVLFADLIGFTPLAARLGPERAVELLNEIFSAFDRLADRYRVEKIKTLGDGYMAVAGAPVPIPDEDHSVSVAEMSLEMLRWVTDLSAREG